VDENKTSIFSQYPNFPLKPVAAKEANRYRGRAGLILHLSLPLFKHANTGFTC